MDSYCKKTPRRPAAATIFSLALAAILLSACKPEQGDQPADVVRLATFNMAMGLPEEGQLTSALQQGQHPPLQSVAEIIQRVRPDVLVLNEFDYDPGIDAAALLNAHYLNVGQNGQEPIDYPFHFRSGVNTGIDSGLDLDGNGALGEPQDAWGFGTFPGQFGTLVLSRFPIDAAESRTFQQFRWANLPGAQRPVNPDGSPYYPDEIWSQLRLASKSYWDLQLEVEGGALHLLTFHPTPPVFDGPEDRNGLRNSDEIRFWAEYLSPATADYIVDDQGHAGGLEADKRFVIAGDFNSDPFDGDSVNGAVQQLLDHPRINSACQPESEGGRQASQQQAGLNVSHKGNPALDTSDFNDEFTGNLRLDYLLPSLDLNVVGCGVFWPVTGEPGSEAIYVSDHRMVWLDIAW